MGPYRTLAIRIGLALPLLTAVAGVVGVTPARAQLSTDTAAPGPEAALIEGRYALVVEESDDIEAAIEASIREMNFLTRRIARGRLRKTNEPHRTLEIGYPPGEFSVSMDDAPPILSPETGEPITWQRDDGESFEVRTTWVDGALRQTFSAEDGHREAFFRPDPDGRTVRMHVTVTSDRLPAPVVYTLVFRRVE